MSGPGARPFLMIAPYFPPVGVSGAKRALHLARHLPQHGWQPVVLAAQPGLEPQDPRLAAAIPPELLVSRSYVGPLRPALGRLAGLRARLAGAVRRPGPSAQTKAGGQGPPSAPAPAARLMPWHPSYLTPFDRYLVDTPWGFAEGLRLIRRHALQAIHVCADPWAPLLTGWALASATGLPLVVDLRDPWSLQEAKMALRPPPTRWLLRRCERALFEQAARVVLNTEAARSAYVSAYAGRVPGERFVAIRNAFDRGLFSEPAQTEQSPDDPFVVLYFGRFRLFVGPEQLLEGFGRFVRRAGLSPAQARLRFVGGLRPQDRVRGAELGLDARVEERRPVPFVDSLQVLRSAHVLALVIEPNCPLQIPGKLYDYLAAGRPVLAVSANPEADRILADTQAGVAVPWGRPDEVAAGFERLHRQVRADGGWRPDEARLAPYAAASQARRFAAVLSEACA